jgi:RNA polymerase sigma-54 factor
MQPARSSDDVDRKLEAMRNTPSTYHSLGDALLEQIALLDLDERGHAIVEYIVYSLDKRGYLPDPLEELVADCGIEGITLEEMENVLHELRAATHPALGAQDLRECLLLQLDALHIEAPLVRTLISEHLEDITTNLLPRIARATGRTIDEINQAIETIRSLDPIPGREYGQSSAETIHPDVIVEEVDGSYEVRLTREGVPTLRVSPSHRKLLRQAARGDSVQKWVKQRIESARWFIDALEQRQSTLLRISKEIFATQEAFLERGLKALVPLRMLEVADRLGIHISTVSRAVAGKYAQTPQGIHPLRFFFSGGTSKASGGMASQASIKQRIKELIEKEDAKSPYSDDRIAELLKEWDGISIARRTVTKYRKAMSIPSSSQRRRF